MEDWLLIRIGLCVSIIGVCALFFLSQGHVDEPSDALVITGDVINVIHRNDSTIFQLSTEGTTDVIVFDDVDISIGESVSVVGEKDGSYVVAERIRREKTQNNQ